MTKSLSSLSKIEASIVLVKSSKGSKIFFGENWVTSYAADAPIFPLDFDNNDPTIEARDLLDKQGTEVPVGEVGLEAVVLAFPASRAKTAAAIGDGRKASAVGAKPAAGTGDGGKAAATSEVAANFVDGTDSGADDANAVDAGTKVKASR